MHIYLLYLLVSHGISNGKQPELQKARAEKRLSAPHCLVFLQRQCCLGETVASGAEADLQVVQVMILVRTALSSPASAASR